MEIKCPDDLAGEAVWPKQFGVLISPVPAYRVGYLLTCTAVSARVIHTDNPIKSILNGVYCR